MAVRNDPNELDFLDQLLDDFGIGENQKISTLRGALERELYGEDDDDDDN